jgi:hypothetical protein
MMRHFKTHKSLERKNNIVVGSSGPESKNDYACEGQQKFTGLDWTELN